MQVNFFTPVQFESVATEQNRIVCRYHWPTEMNFFFLLVKEPVGVCGAKAEVVWSKFPPANNGFVALTCSAGASQCVLLCDKS